ncbi:hypothetical protein BJ138DRAFT_1163266 [Hygrophoropsis aurantiaca]|uniref:Uncharacterized protein n=1 Tax=Hygrophoropsis aurantiaca TaxID=72124 RepID=A0ACB7ZY52_9AGAM|nr:hypothetical protein BJ138DRAFT_1163266 [Hygrophoropsis aurantiaca]
MEDIRNTSSSAPNLTDDELYMLFAAMFPSGPNVLGNGEGYNSNGGTQQERPFDYGDATLDDPFAWVNVGNESLNDGNSAESWNSGGNQRMYGDHPQSHTCQVGHINVDTVAPSDLQLVPDQHLLAQNSGNSPFAVPAAVTPPVSKHSCDKWIPMTKKAISKHLRRLQA